MPHQIEFAFTKSSEKFMGGGWGATKSAALVYAGVIASYHFCPPGVPGGFVLPRFDMMHKFINEHFRPMLGHLIVSENKTERWIELVGGRRFYYMSGHDPRYIEGVNLGWIGIDEAGLMKAMIYPKCRARVRHPKAFRHQTFVTGVPLWGWLQKTFAGRRDSQRYHMKVRTADNPYLPEDYVPGLLASVPPRLIPQYVEGEFVPPGASVYYMFGLDTHVFDFELISTVTDGPKHNRVINRPCEEDCGVVIDPSARTPHVLFVQNLRPGYFLKGDFLEGGYELQHPASMVYDEIYPGMGGEAISTEDLWDRIFAKNLPVSWILIDKAGKQVKESDGKSFFDKTRLLTGITPMMVTNPALTRVRNSVELTQTRLNWEYEHPWVYFARSLLQNVHDRAVLRAITNYQFPEHKEGKEEVCEPIKDGITDHAMDCLRYLVAYHYPLVDRRIITRGRS